MARSPFPFRLRRRRRAALPEQGSGAELEPTGMEVAGTDPPPRRRPLPAPGRLRRERRMLLRQREERVRDLGGLVLEMYRRDDYRHELVEERCAELSGLDERLYELDLLLRAAVGARRTAPAARCECGTPIPWGSRFCATCGRPVGTAPALACETCGAALAGNARFCAACGTPVGPSAEPPRPGPSGQAEGEER